MLRYSFFQSIYICSLAYFYQHWCLETPIGGFIIFWKLSSLYSESVLPVFAFLSFKLKTFFSVAYQLLQEELLKNFFLQLRYEGGRYRILKTFVFRECITELLLDALWSSKWFVKLYFTKITSTLEHTHQSCSMSPSTLAQQSDLTVCGSLGNSWILRFFPIFILLTLRRV